MFGGGGRGGGEDGGGVQGSSLSTDQNTQRNKGNWTNRVKIRRRKNIKPQQITNPKIVQNIQKRFSFILQLEGYAL